MYVRDINNEIHVSCRVLDKKKANPHLHPNQETLRCRSSLYFCSVPIIPSVNTFPLKLTVLTLPPFHGLAYIMSQHYLLCGLCAPRVGGGSSSGKLQPWQ